LTKHDVNRFLENITALPPPIPILRDVADLIAEKNRRSGPIKKRIERFYMRLCRLQEELGRMDLKKARLGAALGVTGYKTLEDFAFSTIDFSRYRKITEKEFDKLFPEGLTDFEESFLKKSFGLGREELQSVIEESYQKAEGEYRLLRENSLILSVMRALETSLEAVPIFTAAEVTEELQTLPSSIREKLPTQLYPLLVSSLDNALVTHSDGRTTKLSLSPKGDLAGTFQPGGKPWTLVLIPAELL